MSGAFTPARNPDAAGVAAIVAASVHKAARRITDTRTGDQWVWPFEQATHAEGAERLGVPYSIPAGEGDVLFLD